MKIFVNQVKFIKLVLLNIYKIISVEAALFLMNKFIHIEKTMN